MGVGLLYVMQDQQKIGFIPDSKYLLKMSAFWDIVPSSHIEVKQCFRGVYYLHHEDDESDDGGSIRAYKPTHEE
jgi:hypothetical protein